MALLAYDDVWLGEPRLMVPRTAPVKKCKPNHSVIRGPYAWSLPASDVVYINGKKIKHLFPSNYITPIGKALTGNAIISDTSFIGFDVSSISFLLLLQRDGGGGTVGVLTAGNTTDGCSVTRYALGFTANVYTSGGTGADGLQYCSAAVGDIGCCSGVVTGSSARFIFKNFTTGALASETDTIGTPAAMTAGLTFTGASAVPYIFGFVGLFPWSQAEQLEYVNNPFLLCIPE